MKITQYIQFTEPGEKDRLEQLVKESGSNMELQMKITREFKVSMLDARFIAKRAQEMFNQINQV